MGKQSSDLAVTGIIREGKTVHLNFKKDAICHSGFIWTDLFCPWHIAGSPLWEANRENQCYFTSPLCYDEIGTYWCEVFLLERALWAVLIPACEEFCMSQHTEAWWSHLYLDVYIGMSQEQGYITAPIPSRAFTGTIVSGETVRDKVKNHLSFTLP